MVVRLSVSRSYKLLKQLTCSPVTGYKPRKVSLQETSSKTGSRRPEHTKRLLEYREEQDNTRQLGEAAERLTLTRVRALALTRLEQQRHLASFAAWRCVSCGAATWQRGRGCLW